MFASLELFEHNPGIAQTSEVPQVWGLPELPFLPGAGHVPEMCLCSKVTPWPWPGDTSWRQFFPQTGGEISLYPQTVPSTGSSSTWTIFPICRIPCSPEILHEMR